MFRFLDSAPDHGLDADVVGFTRVRCDASELIDVGEDSGPSGTSVTKKVPCSKDCDGCLRRPYEYRVHRDGDGLM